MLCRKDAVRRRLLAEHNCYPVFVAKDLKDKFESFCWDTLWPNLHSMSTFFNQQQFSSNTQNLVDTFASEYDSFQYFNNLFVDKVTEVFNEGDLVLVYGYELMLLPAMLRRRIPDLTCAFFLHSPFASSEYFRMLPSRDKFLQGILGADMVAFNHFDYVRHFLNCCTSVLGLPSFPSRIDYQGRQISIEICPSGIDPSWFQPALKSSHLLPSLAHDVRAGAYSPPLTDFDESVSGVSSFAPPPSSFASTSGVDDARELIARLNKRFRRNGMKLVVSLDRLDWCKGVPNKLTAFDTFFEVSPYPDE